MTSKQLINTKWQKKITALRKKYAPRKTFDLIYCLEELKNSLSSMDKMSQLLRSKSKDQKRLATILKNEKKKLKSLSKISAHFKYEIDMFFFNGNKMNTNSLTMISTVNQANSIFSVYQSTTNIFLNTCSLFVNATKSNHGSRNYKYSKSQLSIHFLIRIFHKMTGEMPECANDRTLEKGDEGYNVYDGKFYKFLLELRPLLKEAFDINLGADKVIGKYANKFIKQYKEEISL